MHIKLSCGIMGSMDNKVKKGMETIINNCSSHAAPKFLSSTAKLVLLAVQSFASIQACGATISNEQEARKMLTSIAETTGSFESAGV